MVRSRPLTVIGLLSIALATASAGFGQESTVKINGDLIPVDEFGSLSVEVRGGPARFADDIRRAIGAEFTTGDRFFPVSLYDRDARTLIVITITEAKSVGPGKRMWLSYLAGGSKVVADVNVLQDGKLHAAFEVRAQMGTQNYDTDTDWPVARELGRAIAQQIHFISTRAPAPPKPPLKLPAE